MTDIEIIKWFETRVGNLCGYNFLERDEAYNRAIEVLKERQEMMELKKS